MKRVAIVQSSYIPWKGYFDMINAVDEFVLYDDRQFTKRDWRSRNRVKSAQGTIWLTIPVEVKGRFHQRIDETIVQGSDWRRRHWDTLRHSYSAAPHFDTLAAELEPLYCQQAEASLSSINRAFIEAVCHTLEIRTPLSWSSDYDAEGGRSERLLSLCDAVGATEYLSGPSAREYLDESLFEAQGIEVLYMDYSGYPEYDQLHPPFDHAVTVLDLLFNTGSEARHYMKTFPESAVKWPPAR